MSRSRAFTRYQRRAHISRKKRIIAGGNIWQPINMTKRPFSDATIMKIPFAM